MFRANVRGLKEMYVEEMPMANFLEALCGVVERLTKQKKGEMESYRNYLMRMKAELGQGLTWMGWVGELDSMFSHIFAMGWIAPKDF